MASTAARAGLAVAKAGSVAARLGNIVAKAASAKVLTITSKLGVTASKTAELSAKAAKVASMAQRVSALSTKAGRGIAAAARSTAGSRMLMAAGLANDVTDVAVKSMAFHNKDREINNQRQAMLNNALGFRQADLNDQQRELLNTYVQQQNPEVYKTKMREVYMDFFGDPENYRDMGTDDVAESLRLLREWMDEENLKARPDPVYLGQLRAQIQKLAQLLADSF